MRIATTASFVLIAACTGGDRPAGPRDAGRDSGFQDLGRVCNYYDGGGTDFGPLPDDAGPLVRPDLSVPPPDAGPPSATTVNGCPVLYPCLALAGSDAGLTYDGFAAPLFATYCTRCHSTTLTGAARNMAPDGYNWDDRTSVYAHLPQIRAAIGVANYMPYDRPTDLSCDRRHAVVIWIDTGAP